METRKIILNNLFSGKECRYICRKWLVDTVGEREGWTNGEVSMDIYI